MKEKIESSTIISCTYVHTSISISFLSLSPPTLPSPLSFPPFLSPSLLLSHLLLVPLQPSIDLLSLFNTVISCKDTSLVVGDGNEEIESITDTAVLASGVSVNNNDDDDDDDMNNKVEDVFI